MTHRDVHPGWRSAIARMAPSCAWLRVKKKNAGEHRQDHQTVEVRRPGKTVNDQWIPGIPGRVGEARRATDQTQKDRDCRKIRGGEEQFVSERTRRETTERGEKQFCSRWINRAVIAVVDPAPIGKLGTDRGQLLVVRGENVGIEARVLHFPLPLVTPQVVARLERQRDDPQEDRRHPKSHTRHPAQRHPGERRGGREKGDPAEHRRLDELDRHRRVAPVVETVERREEQNLGEQREPETRMPV